MPKKAVAIKVAGIGDNGGPSINSWGEKGPTPAQVIATDLLGGEQRHTMLVGGARSGKTTALVRTICLRAIVYPGSRHVILRFRAVHADASVALDTIPKVMKMCFPGVRYRHVKSPHNLIRFPNGGPNRDKYEGGSEIWIGGLDDAARVDKILGNEYATIFLNECSQITWYSAKLVRSRLAQVVDGCKQRMLYDINPVGKSHWTNRLFGDKVDPDNGRTPIGDPENYERMFINPIDNIANLDAGYVKELESSTGNYRKRFYEGAYIDEVSNALWSLDMIEACRINPGEEPEYVQTVICIDPSGASEAGDKSDIENKPKNDEIGIVVVSLGKDQKVYLRADLSLIAGPIGQGIDDKTGQKNMGWAEIAVAAYHYYKADHILAEINFGGGMVESVIRAADGNVPVKTVRASVGKHIRAEPVSTLYTRDMVRHVGQFRQLEDQLCAFTSLGYGGSKSPDRADALVWAVTDMVLQNGPNNWIEYYRRLNEGAGTLPEQQGVVKKPEFGFDIAPPTKKTHRIKVPDGISTLYLMDGRQLLVPEDHIVEVSAEDATAFAVRGWERLAA